VKLGRHIVPFKLNINICLGFSDVFNVQTYNDYNIL